jgi:hypothetical protein
MPSTFPDRLADKHTLKRDSQHARSHLNSEPLPTRHKIENYCNEKRNAWKFIWRWASLDLSTYRFILTKLSSGKCFMLQRWKVLLTSTLVQVSTLGCPISLYPTLNSSSRLTRPFARQLNEKRSVRLMAGYKRKLRRKEPRHDKRRKAS